MSKISFVDDFIVDLENEFVSRAKLQNKEFNEDSFSVYKLFFNKVKAYEENVNKNFLDLSDNEIVEFIYNGSTNTKSILKYKNMLEMYLKWLNKKQYISYEKFATHIIFDKRAFNNNIADNELKYPKIKQDYFLSSDEFVSFVNALYNIEQLEGDTSRYHSRMAVLYLLWQGFSEEEIVNLKESDLNIKEKTIKGVKLINDEIADFLISYSEEKYYLTLNRNREFYQVEYYRTGEFIKGKLKTSSPTVIKMHIDSARRRLREVLATGVNIKDRLNPKKIMISGVFERLDNYEKSTGIIVNQYNIIHIINEILNRETSEFNDYYLFDDYLIWKEVKWAR